MSSDKSKAVKRKPPWKAKREAKRFNYDRGETSSRHWVNHEHQAHHNHGNSYRRDHFQDRPPRGYDRRRNLPNLFDYPMPYPNQPPQEQDLETAESTVLEKERREKILATKKRIEEALASTNPSSQDINLADAQEIVQILKDKSSETNACIKEGVGLRLTNSDFKEIGSVESGVATELDTSEMILNVSPVVAQQRSFDNTGVSAQLVPPTAKNRVEGWTMSSANEISAHTYQRVQESPNSGLKAKRGPQTMSSLITSEPGKLSNSTRKKKKEIFLQESREEILGTVDPATRQEKIDRPSPKPSQSRRDFTNVGNLYQSFLRTRLFGYTYRQRNKTVKPSGPNPLLDKSVLESQNSKKTSRQQNTILELQMPRPILIKAELDDAVNTESIEEEANEFCKEYSYLLTDPNLLIPSENLEKLGLGHLSEMNDLVSKRSDQALTSSPSNQDKIFRVRPSNSKSGKDLMIEQSASSSTSNIDPGNTQLFRFNFQPSKAKESILNNSTSNGQIDNAASISGQGVSVNTIADKVVEKLFSTLNNSTSNQQLNVQTLLQRQTGTSTDNNHGTSSEPTHSSAVKTLPPPDLVQTISSYILKIFLIDKQIEELSQEKMKIYSELLSIKDISSSLFNSWAQEQITKGNVVNCQTNQSNIIPQLMRLNGITNHGDFVEALAPERHLKREYSEVPSTSSEIVQSSIPSISLDPLSSICSTPPSIPPEIIKPKLSVRKDLHDHSLQNSNFESGIVPLNNESDTFNAPTLVENPEISQNEIPKEPCFVKVEGTPQDFSGFETVETNIWMNPVDKQEICEDKSLPKKKNKKKVTTSERVNCDKKKKKKTKKKKENIMEVVDLLDSTEEESESVFSFEATDPLETGEPVVKKQSTGNSTLKEFSCSIKNTPTCMRVCKKKIAFIGSKEGFLIGFSLTDGQLLFEEKIHKESITCLTIHTINKQRFVIMGSLDSTVSVFSIRKQKLILSFQVGAPVQCCWLRSSQIFFGTKNGQLGVYNLVVNGEGLIIVEDQPKIKLTDCSIMALATGDKDTCSQNEIIVASRGETVTIRDIKTGDVLHALDWCDTVTSLVVREEIVYCGTNTRSVKGVNVITREKTADCIVGRCVVAMSMGICSVLLAACKDGNIYAFNTEEGRLITTIPTPSSQVIQSIAISENMILMVSSSSIKSITMPAELAEYFSNYKPTNSS